MREPRMINDTMVLEDMYDLLYDVLFEKSSQIPLIIGVKKSYNATTANSRDYGLTNDDTRIILKDSRFRFPIGVRGTTPEELEYAETVFDKLKLKHTGIEKDIYEKKYPYKITAEVPNINGEPMNAREYFDSVGLDFDISRGLNRIRKSEVRYGSIPDVPTHKAEDEKEYHLNLPKNMADYYRYGNRVKVGKQKYEEYERASVEDCEIIEFTSGEEKSVARFLIDVWDAEDDFDEIVHDLKVLPEYDRYEEVPGIVCIKIEDDTNFPRIVNTKRTSKLKEDYEDEEEPSEQDKLKEMLSLLDSLFEIVDGDKSIKRKFFSKTFPVKLDEYNTLIEIYNDIYDAYMGK